MEALGGKARLSILYNELAGHAKTKGNQNWQAKIRQTLQVYTNDFKHIAEGHWALAS